MITAAEHLAHFLRITGRADDDVWSEEAREAAAEVRRHKTPFDRAMERTQKAIAKTEREKAKYGGLTAPTKERKISGPSEYDPHNPLRKKF